MSKSAPASQKKRKLEEGMRGKISRPKKRIRKQRNYHSSSEDEDISDSGFVPVSLGDSDEEVPLPATVPKPRSVQKLSQAAEPEGSDDDSQSASDQDQGEGTDSQELETGTGQDARRKRSKRNDPKAFSTSISKILSTKLPQSARRDPVLSRSRDAVETSLGIANERLEQRARAKLRADKKEDLQKGRIKDVTGISSGQAGDVAEEEKRLRKIAQRGVVKLFNAVRAAQVRAEQALKEERKKGTVGHANREEKANEMSKQGFLELISGKKAQAIEEG